MDNKKTALEFMGLITSGKIDEAYEKYVDISGKHHNAFFAAGFESLRQAMKDNHKQFPVKQISIKNVLADGDLVAVHSNIIVDPDKINLSAVHIFRFQDSKIIEMWDISQLSPVDNPNKEGLF